MQHVVWAKLTQGLTAKKLDLPSSEQTISIMTQKEKAQAYDRIIENLNAAAQNRFQSYGVDFLTEYDCTSLSIYDSEAIAAWDDASLSDRMNQYVFGNAFTVLEMNHTPDNEFLHLAVAVLSEVHSLRIINFEKIAEKLANSVQSKGQSETEARTIESKSADVAVNNFKGLGRLLPGGPGWDRGNLSGSD